MSSPCRSWPGKGGVYGWLRIGACGCENNIAAFLAWLTTTLIAGILGPAVAPQGRQPPLKPSRGGAVLERLVLMASARRGGHFNERNPSHS